MSDSPKPHLGAAEAVTLPSGWPTRVRELEILGVTVTQFNDGYEALLPSGDVMKADTLMSLLGQTIQLNATRLMLAGCVIVSLSALLIAHALQESLALFPCSLCILQRYTFGLLALTALVAMFRPRLMLFAVGALEAVVGIGLGVKQLYVMAHPSMTCGRDALQEFLNALPSAELAPTWFQVTGLCGDKLPDVAGLPIPVWALMGFIAILCVQGALIQAHLTSRRKAARR